VTAVWYRFRAEWRSRWRAWLGLGLLLGLAAGAVLALAAGARRTDSAYDRFLESHNAYDVMVSDFGQAGFPGVGGFDKIRALPSVEDSAAGELGVIPLGRSHVIALASEDGRIGTDINAFKLLEGRRADPERADEAVLTYAAAQVGELRVGSTIPFVAAEHVDEITDPDEAAAARRFLAAAPDGRLRIVGVEASPGELPPQMEDEDALALHLTPALYRLHLLSFPDPPITPKVLLVELRDGADGASAFNADLNRLSEGPGFDSIAQADHAAVVERSIHLQAVALWLLAGLVAISATLIAGQLLSRLTLVEATDHVALGALGMSARARALLGVVRAGVVGGVAAVAGTVIAVAVSSALPTGVARIAEPNPGPEVDVLVVGLGATATVVVVTALGAWAAWRAAAAKPDAPASGDQGVRRRPSGVARALTAVGGWPLPATVGVRMALEPGRGPSAVPVRTTLAGVVLGVGALVGALTFGASLAHLLDSPRLYGQTWDLQLEDASDETFAERGRLLLSGDPRVEAIGIGSAGSALLEVEGRRADAIALDAVEGDILPPMLAGNPPRGADEVALGARTARAVGADIGDVVEVARSDDRAVPMRVVGRVAFPSVGTASQLGDGVLATVAARDAVSPDEGSTPDDLFLRLAPGADPAAVVADLNARAGTHAFVQSTGSPADIVNFGRVESMPFVLGGILAAIAGATLAHLLLSAVRRRRRDLAILKTLGFVRGQVAGTVAWQATAVVVASLVVAMPLGVALGRWVWTWLADDLGVVAQPQVPLMALAAVGAGAILLANAIAVVPGQIAARTQPATDLRSE
jgi:ABC-type lipoprotein release transport system permease subunit